MRGREGNQSRQECKLSPKEANLFARLFETRQSNILCSLFALCQCRRDILEVVEVEGGGCAVWMVDEITRIERCDAKGMCMGRTGVSDVKRGVREAGKPRRTGGGIKAVPSNCQISGDDGDVQRNESARRQNIACRRPPSLVFRAIPNSREVWLTFCAAHVRAS